MSDGLKSKTIHGLFWSFFERIGQQGIQFVISIILARLLLPEEFGLIAMLTIFMAVAQAFLDSGFGSALIQKQDADQVDESSIFYFNIFVGLAAAGLLCLAAPWIAAFYKTPILVPLTRVLSLNLIINAFGLVQTSLMTKRVDFKTQMKISMIATSLSGSIGTIMAYKGFGVWSLVAFSLSGNFFRTVFLWVFNRWRPAWMFSFASLQSMFGFGSKLLFSGLINTVFQNLYLMVIGKIFSAADLGFYSRANGIQQLPVRNVSSTVSRVTYPVFSSIQDDKPRLKNGLRKAMTSMAMVNFPLMIGLIVVAEPLVQVLLTDKWLPCVPYLRLLCVVGMLYPLQVINLNVLIAQGRSDLLLRLEVLKKILIAAAIFITYRWGIIALIYGQIATILIAYYLNSYYSGKMLDYPITEQIRDILPSLGLACAMGGGIYMLCYIPIPSQTVLLFLQIISGIAIYILLCHIFRLSSFKEIIELVKPRLLIFRSAN